MSRDWQKDMELCQQAKDWEFYLTFDGCGDIEENGSTIASVVGVIQADIIFNALEALPHWLKEVKGQCEVNQKNQREILSLRIRLAAEKERADKAERKEQKLKEALEHCIKEFPQWDSKEIAGTLMVDYMNNILSILYPTEGSK